MANPDHLAKLNEGVKAWNRWRQDNPLIRVDLFGAHLSEAHLRGADLTRANLRGAHLSGADLSRADLTRADLTQADLMAADLTRANLRGAHLIGASFHETIFGATNLSAVDGLDACQHSGPSTIDHRTFALSGPLPLVFLRGCGLPDALIDYLPSLLNQPIQFYSCFISYSTRDQQFAERLYADLQANNVRCWFAPHDVRAGRKLYEQIDEAIRVHDKLLLILSTHSIESEWVKTEISKAREREAKEKKRILFPIRLVPFKVLQSWECFDDDRGKDSAREIREYYVPDFCRWKDHDSFQTEFQKLLRDLKAG